MQELAATVGILVDGLFAVGIDEIEDIVGVATCFPHLSPFLFILRGERDVRVVVFKFFVRHGLARPRIDDVVAGTIYDFCACRQRCEHAGEEGEEEGLEVCFHSVR